VIEEAVERAAVVAEARTWLRTPYHHKARLKGVGVDCAYFLAEVYHAVLPRIPRLDFGHYPPDWHLHRSEEVYLSWLDRYATLTYGTPQPGDVVVFRFGRCFSHGVIVVEWPEVIHAYLRIGCILGDATKEPLVGHDYRIYTLWGPSGR